MNRNNRVFAHQERSVAALCDYFDEVTVLTAEGLLDFEQKPNLNVITTNWVPNRMFVNLMRFYFLALPLLVKHRRQLVFSHMTEVQSFLISIPCKLLSIKHLLWYAHASRSVFLYLSYPLLSGLISSTKGSCPISGKKVHLIGQGVVNMFDVSQIIDPELPPLRWFYFGRMDISKRIHLVIEAVKHFRDQGLSLELDLIGDSSSIQDREYIDELRCKYQNDITDGWIQFWGSVPNSQLRYVLASYDGFIHGFPGSLDKTLVESALARRHVVTANQEFHNVFQTGSRLSDDASKTLLQLLAEVLKFDASEAKRVLDARSKIAKFHTMDQWTKRLAKVLLDA